MKIVKAKKAPDLPSQASRGKHFFKYNKPFSINKAFYNASKTN